MKSMGKKETNPLALFCFAVLPFLLVALRVPLLRYVTVLHKVGRVRDTAWPIVRLVFCGLFCFVFGARKGRGLLLKT